ncbi:ABC transporter permease [Alkalibacillus salilacus]|uniref:ABC-2 type transporter transmembrane domain-containing protein n=1 Tax=Alkalibacillus salilacus TaxID=284582 RepID=A0ABT9VGG8_9BACI|nr:ABC transporter permease [Alkalibacillus salilacus]MDQ0159900.1 hypothetical protein [Alkalibacillus salilacus]
MMIVKSMLWRRSTLLTLLGLPLLILVVILPFVEKTTENTQVRIDVVDPYNQSYVEQMVNRLNDRESFSLNLNDQLELSQLARGEVEAIFVVEDQFQEKVEEGETENILTWYRHEHSLVDGLFKEYFASTLMEDIVRSEAANIVTDETEMATWNEAYQYGAQFFRPEPLFQMNFTTYESNTIEGEDSSNWPIALVWAYMILIIVYFSSWLYEWRNRGVFDRLAVFPHGKFRLHLTWIKNVLGTILIASLGFMGINEWLKIMALDFGQYGLLALVSVISLFIIWLISFFIRSRHVLIAVTTIYTVIGVALVLLVEWDMLSVQNWYQIWLPFWFVN